MVDAANPFKYLLFAWLLVSSFLAGVRLTRRLVGVTEPLDIAGYSLGFAMLIMGCAGNLLARVTHSLPVAFILLASALSVPTLRDLWRRRGRGITSHLPPSAPNHAGAGVLTRRERLLALAFGVVVTIPPLAMIWRTHLWDDWYAHLPMVSVLSRGVLPLVEPFLPDRLLTYHYGHNWLTAVLQYHTGLSPEHGVDVISTAMLVTWFLAGAGTFRLWVGGRQGPYVAAGAVIGLGTLSWLWGLTKALATWDVPSRAFFMGWVKHAHTTFSYAIATSADYLLQKPMVAGESLLWTAIAVFFVARKRSSLSGAAAAGTCVGMLELFHFPTALLMGAASAVVLGIDFLFDAGARQRRALMLAAFGAAAFTVTHLNGGFVANPQEVSVAMERVWNFPLKTIVEFAKPHKLSAAFCYLFYYGLPLFVLPLMLPRLWRLNRQYLIWFAVFFWCGFALPHLFHHRNSPGDITKFSHLSSFAITTLGAAGLLAATQHWRRSGRAFALGVFLICGSLSTWFASYEASVPRPFAADAASVASLRRMAGWLRAHAGTYDRAFALTDEMTAMSGVLSPLPPFAPGDRQVFTLHTYGYSTEYIAKTKDLTTSIAAWMDDPSLQVLKIRWVVLPYPFPDEVGGEARRRLADQKLFHLSHQTTPTPGGAWRIYEYLKGPAPGSLRK